LISYLSRCRYSANSPISGRASIRARTNLFAGHEFHCYGGYRIGHSTRACNGECLVERAEPWFGGLKGVRCRGTLSRGGHGGWRGLKGGFRGGVRYLDASSTAPVEVRRLAGTGEKAPLPRPLIELKLRWGLADVSALVGFEALVPGWTAARDEARRCRPHGS
jgi:hypothetical protein